MKNYQFSPRWSEKWTGDRSSLSRWNVAIWCILLSLVMSPLAREALYPYILIIILIEKVWLWLLQSTHMRMCQSKRPPSLPQGSIKTLPLFRIQVHLQTKTKMMRKHPSTWSIKMFHQRSELTRRGPSLIHSILFQCLYSFYYLVYSSTFLVHYRV